MKTLGKIGLSSCVMVLIFSVALAVEEPPQFLLSWPSEPSFYYPIGIAVDMSGNVYVADTQNHRIKKLDSNGNVLLTWGTYGSGDGQFYYPRGMAVDSLGNLYVADTYNHRIQKFTSEGVFLTKWGTYGSGDGQFRYLQGVTVDSSGNVYVADYENHRIQKFTSEGVFLTKWGTYGSGDGQFSYPTGIAVDNLGSVYVANRGNHRIQKFTSEGVFLTKWGTYGSGDGQFRSPRGIAVDSLDNVYVADYENHRIQKFTSEGIFVTKWGTDGIGDGQFRYPRSVAVDSLDNVNVVDTNNHRIQKFTSNGVFLTKWGTYGIGNGQFRYFYDVAVDSLSNVYVIESDNNRIQKFTSNGVFLTKWGTYGTGDGQFEYPYSVAADSLDNVYVADTYNHRIQKFTSEGVFLTKWGTYGLGDGQFSFPICITVDSLDNVYVTDVNNFRVQKFTSEGVFLTRWGTYGSGNGQFDRPLGVAVDSLDNVYVADIRLNRIQKFTSEGIFLTAWSTSSPYGVAVDGLDNVYVADTDNHRVQKFTSEGVFLTNWGTYGPGNGQFREPRGIAIDEAGTIYVADAGNYRIQKFGNTRSGTNIEISAPESGTTIIFTEVTVGGNTIITITETGPPPPTGFRLVPLGTYYEIKTSATYTGLITICINYDDTGLTPGQEAQLKVRQYNEATSEWINITTSLDTVNNIICGQTDHLSFFGVMYQLIPPIANVNGPYTGNEGSPIIFDASASSDPDGTIVLYEWDLDGDGLYDDATGVNPTYTWGDNYTGIIGLKVIDSDGLIDTDTSTVTILNVAPTTNAGPDKKVPIGDTTAFNGNFTDSGWLDTHTVLWNFGDNTTQTGTLTEENNPPDATGQVTGTHVYSTAGIYTVTLNVQDDDGGVGTDTLQVIVPIPATIDINPDTINLKSKGQRITSYIELPTGYDVNNIDITTVTISRDISSVPAETTPTEVGDFDSDGIPDLMVKFDRPSVHQMLSLGSVELTVSGSLTTGLYFEGTELVNVIDTGKDHIDEIDHSSVEY